MSGAYADAVVRALPRVLARFDADPTSASHGYGDRFHWAWSLIDFGNGTFQGAAHGLARLWMGGSWPYPTGEARFLARLDAMFAATRRLARRNGSLEEAFPHEGSFCVTAQVAHDLLIAIEVLRPRLDAGRLSAWREAVAPLAGFLLRADETHGLISNHLASAVAALLRWHRLADAPAAEARARMLLDRILAAQSPEGWFSEYDGFDAGYQSLCTAYLADVDRLRPDWDLADPLARSVRFLCQFAHPDGSFGGLYGRRATRFYYPAGIEALADRVPEAAALADRMHRSIESQCVVGLDGIDEPNLVPMFNAYCWAHDMRRARAPRASDPRVLPAFAGGSSRIHHPQAGLWIDAGPRHYTVVSSHLGGVVSHFVDGRAAVLDGGVVVRDAQGRLGSTQGYDPGNRAVLEGDELQVESTLRPMPKRLPTPLQFLLLRALCLSVFRVGAWRELAKRWLARWLITRRDAWPVRHRRRIRLGEDLRIVDEPVDAPGYARVPVAEPFVAVHMASQGYWQLQDESSP